MSVYPEELAAHLGRTVTTVCHCWRLTRTDGHVTGYTDHDRPLTAGATLFAPQTGLAASEARDTLGLAVDTVDVEGALSSDDIRDEDIAAGLYDGATVETLLVNWRQPEDFVLLRKATVGRITRTDGRFVAELESLAHSLDRPSGRFVSRICDAELGDSRCGVDLGDPAFMGAGEIETVETPLTLVATGLETFAAGWFTLGVLTWTSGAREGRRERVEMHRKDATGTTLVLQPGASAQVAEGNTFTIVAGCDKRFATCKSKFANALNFRGFPHLPGNDAAYGYVVDGGRFDGGPLVP
ncbi:MAG: DUF2163 domain-containing protein [Mesorhizobium sp.]|nr:DUF2163 domain-containing protein [Mesorhizobium sp.]MBL8579011.1 DUF2163 domain-containing protein [Mesorhizobium sp.]